MIDLKSIHEMWSKDCIIDSNKLDESSRQAPLLHAKYLELLTTYKLQLKRAEFDQKKLGIYENVTDENSYEFYVRVSGRRDFKNHFN